MSHHTPVSYTHLDVYKRQRYMCDIQYHRSIDFFCIRFKQFLELAKHRIGVTCLVVTQPPDRESNSNKLLYVIIPPVKCLPTHDCYALVLPWILSCFVHKKIICVYDQRLVNTKTLFMFVKFPNYIDKTVCMSILAGQTHVEFVALVK